MSAADNLSDLQRHAQDFAALDPVLYHAVLAWLERDWPSHSIEYAARQQ
jgi:hypothetical protein